MSLFNFRKRLRHALVSDPQSISKSGSMQLSPSSMSISAVKCKTFEKDVLMETSSSGNKADAHQINRPLKKEDQYHESLLNTASDFRNLTSAPASHSANHCKPTMSSESKTGAFSHSNHQFFPQSIGTKQNVSNNVSAFQRQNKQSTATHPSTIMNNRDRGYNKKENSRDSSFSGTGFQNAGYARYDSVKFNSNQTSETSPPCRPYSTVTQARNAAPSSTSFSGKADNSSGKSIFGRELASGGQLKVRSGTFHAGFGHHKTSTNYGNQKASATSLPTSPGNDLSFPRSPRSGVFDYMEGKMPNAMSKQSGHGHSVKWGVFESSTSDAIPSASKGKPMSSTFLGTKLDASMRFFTCPINVLRAWCCAQLFGGMVMFEVYGKLISSTMLDKTGAGKEFVIRDDSSSIKCIFYEIDRELPILTRGHIYRVVGSYDIKRGILKVVNVRRASREEQHVYESASHRTIEEMQNLGFMTNEP